MGRGGGGILDFGFPLSPSVLAFSFEGVTMSSRNSFGVMRLAVSGMIMLEAETGLGSLGERELASLVDIVV